MSSMHWNGSRSLSRTAALAALCTLVLASNAWAQLNKAKDHRIVFGHLHVHPTDKDAHKKFWVDTLGGTFTRVGTTQSAIFPDGLIEWESPVWGTTAPAGGTTNTTVDHVAFSVSDLRATLDRVRAGGYAIVPRSERAPSSSAPNAFAMGPDGFLVELIEAKGQATAMAMHHIHFAASHVSDMEAWYVTLLSATRGSRGTVVESAIPGSGLVFSPASSPVVGTKGRVLDHIGFEIRDLDAFIKQLEGTGLKTERVVKTKLPVIGEITIAYLTDPWGTYIELSEGLNKVQ